MQPVLRLLTINTHKGYPFWSTRFALHDLRGAIRSTSADIVFLQEVIGRHDARAQRHANWPDEAHHEFLADSIWPDHAYGRNAVYPDGHHGNAVLSRYPIERVEQVDISTNRFEQRGLLYCMVGLPGAPHRLHCICVHMGLFAASRRKQFRMLRAFTDERIPAGEPVVVAGDFNDWTGRNVRAYAASSGMRNAAAEARGKTVRTYPSWMPLLPLDRIYVRGLTAVRLDRCRRGPWSRVSDHAGLYAEVVPELTG